MMGLAVADYQEPVPKEGVLHRMIELVLARVGGSHCAES
jgi:hypothetical protein